MLCSLLVRRTYLEHDRADKRHSRDHFRNREDWGKWNTFCKDNHCLSIRQMKHTEIMQQIGQLFMLRININLVGSVLDAPV